MYLHVDDGLGIVTGKEFTIWASESVRMDLKKYGLLVSKISLSGKFVER